MNEINEDKLKSNSDDLDIDTITCLKSDEVDDKSQTGLYVHGLGVVSESYSLFVKIRYKRLCYYLGICLILFFSFSNIIPTIWYSFKSILVRISPENISGYIFSPIFNEIMTFVIYCINLMVPYLFYKRLIKMPFESLIPNKKNKIETQFICVFIGLAVMILAHHISFYLTEIIRELTPLKIVTPDIKIPIEPFEAIILFMGVVILPAFLEEFVFRGIVLQSLRPHGDGVAIVISSVLFAFSHGSMMQLFSSFVIGLMLGFICVKTGTLKITIVIHFFNNFLAYFSSCLKIYYPVEIVSLIYNILYILLIVLGLAAVFYITKKDKKFFLLKKQNDRMTTAEKASLLLKNACFVGGCLLSVYYIVLSGI